MSSGERKTPFMAWVLLPIGVAVALALAVGTAAAWRARMGPDPSQLPRLGFDVAPAITDGCVPWNSLESACDGDWCALLSREARPRLRELVVRTDENDTIVLIHETVASDGRHSDPNPLEGRGRVRLPLSCLFGRRPPGTGKVTEVARRVGGRIFACARVDFDDGTIFWFSPEVKAPCLVAARVDGIDWELAGFGNGTIAAFGGTLEKLEARVK